MSIQFNQTASPYKGLVQFFEDEIGANRGDVSGNAEKLAKFTSNCNLALDDFWAIAIPASGKWQLDDSNQTDYPVISTNIVSGQRDYSFTTDESSNIILDIYRVMVADSSGVFKEVISVDQQGDQDVSTFYDGQNSTGTPSRYDVTANGIFLDPIPNYNSTGGLKIFINREASYFTTSDTTKKPGVAGIFHSYFYLKPALNYARRNTLTSYNKLLDAVTRLEADIKYHYAGRQRGVRRGMRPLIESTR